MNAALANAAFHAIGAAIATPVSPTVTVEDICALIHQGKHTRRSLACVFDIPADTEINRALRRIDHLISGQVSFRQSKHWAFDSNRLIALVQCRDALGLGLLMRSPR